MLEKALWKITFWMPKKLVYLCTMRLIAFATQGEYGDTVVPELPAMEALNRWEKAFQS